MALARNMEQARLVEFFAVVGRSSSLAGRPSQRQIDQVSSSEKPDGITFAPCVLTQFPKETKHTTIEPKAICQFCFPRGLQLSSRESPPTYFTSILTDGSGRRHYVCVLTVTEELTTLHRTLLFLGVRLPKETKEKEATKGTEEPATTATTATQLQPKWLMDASCPVYCPRSLCIVSRYPFTTQFKTFLQQCVRIALSSSPVPVERYVANFCAETPVPPRGMTSVDVTVADQPLQFSRPPPNQLPMISSQSFESLFRSLDINNVVLAWSCLLLEHKICLCSSSLSILTPASSALLSLLFPFVWCGIYIPVLPHTLLDVIDAPVPFLVGIDVEYLRTTQPIDRPEGVVFINLDTNEIHLGTDEEKGRGVLRERPCLPKHDVSKLMKHLLSLQASLPTVQYRGAFEDFAFTEKVSGFNGDVIPCVPSEVESFAMDVGVMNHRKKKSRSQTTEGSLLFRATATAAAAESSSYETGDIPVGDVRAGFLRFQTSVFKNYRQYIDQTALDFAHGVPSSNSGQHHGGHQKTSTTDMFDVTKFVTNFDRESQETMTKIISTQAWSSFLQQRIDEPWEENSASVAGDAVRYFDEQISAKMNRSMLNRKKKKTPFLNDHRWDHVDSFTVPLPSTQLLPVPTYNNSSSSSSSSSSNNNSDEDEDGRYTCERGRFPDMLRDEWYGKIRTPRQLTRVEIEETATGEVRNVMSRVHHMATNFAGRRMTRSDYDATTLKEFEENEVAKRVSVVDFTNGYAVIPSGGSEASSCGTTTGSAGSAGSASNSKKLSKQHRQQRTRSDFDETLRSVTIMQKVWRGKRCRKMIQRQIHIVSRQRNSQAKRIQHCWRKRVHYIQAILRIQSLLRAFPLRASFVLFREHCISVQALQRGKSCRKLSLMERKMEIHRMRRVIVSGWEECAVPLLQRSRFWTLQSDDSPSYLDLGMHRDEVAWLSVKRREYGLGSRGSGSGSGSGNSGAKSSEGALSHNGRRRVSTSISDELPLPKYPNEFSSLSEAEKALKISRKNLYWRLKGKKGKHIGLNLKDLERHFVGFNLSKQKKRKHKLANVVWTSTAAEMEDDTLFKQICMRSSSVVLACVEDTDMDWALRWRSHRVRVNLLESLRASLVALHRSKSATSVQTR